MTTLALYKPDSIDLKVPFPTQWNELTTPELEFIALYVLSEKKINWPVIFFELLALRLKSITKNASRILKKLDPEQLFLEGLPLIDFLKNEKTLTKFPYAKLSGIDTPKDDFNSTSVAMYEQAAIHSVKWANGKTESFLEIIKALLNPYQFGTQSIYKIEGLYNRFKSWRANRAIKKLKAAQIQVIFLWHIGCENRLPILFPRTFDSTKSNEKSNAASFTKIIHQAATSGNYKRSDIRSLEIKELLFDIECALELQEQEKKLNG